MPFQQPIRTPNIDKLFHYLQKSQWHNVSANFSGFVRKEFDTNLAKLEDGAELYSNLKLMIEYSEMGRFSEAKNILDPAMKEYNWFITKLSDIQQAQQSPKRSGERSSQHATQDYNGKRDTYSPDKRAIASPKKNNEYARNTQPESTQGFETTRQQDRDARSQRSPVRHDDSYRQYPLRPSSEEIHRDNYDSLRIKSPEKQANLYNSSQNKYDSPRPQSLRLSLHGDNDDRQPPYQTTLRQNVSSHAIWGREHGDKPSEKIANSTYRQEFPSYAIENNERTDKERYRENFNSMAERGIWARNAGDSRSGNDPKKRMSIDTDASDYEHRPSELARRFKELYNSEWTDAYDEICKEFGSEKTVRHLLWIVTESALIAEDIADRQLRELERQALDIMKPQTHDHEAWLIAVDIADRQLRDMEKTALGLMTTPGTEYHGGYLPRNLGDTMPASKSLLLKYRKQTAMLSIPYVKEECRDKISRTLMESSGFPKTYLSDASRVTTYILKCAELVWLMCVQDPPIVLEYITKETEGARFNQEHYLVYTKAGTTYDYGVWPSLRQGKRGQILSKGIAQGI